jgi:hypothetical protein
LQIKITSATGTNHVAALVGKMPGMDKVHARIELP